MQWLEGVLHGPAAVQRRAMAKAITLLESTRTDHRVQADQLLADLGLKGFVLNKSCVERCHFKLHRFVNISILKLL